MLRDVLDGLSDLGTPGLCVAVALLAFSETAIMLDLLVPGEVGLVIGGAAAATGDHSVAAVIAAAAAGATVGDLTSYAIGRRWGGRIVDRFEWTRRRFRPALARSEAYFDRHGGRAVFFGRFVGALRAVVPFVAGASRLRLGTFLAWNVAASILWAGAVVTLGATFGRSVADIVDRAGTVVSIVVVLLIALVWWRRRRRHQRADADRGEAAQSLASSGEDALWDATSREPAGRPIPPWSPRSTVFR